MRNSGHKDDEKENQRWKKEFVLKSPGDGRPDRPQAGPVKRGQPAAEPQPSLSFASCSPYGAGSLSSAESSDAKIFMNGRCSSLLFPHASS